MAHGETNLKNFFTLKPKKMNSICTHVLKLVGSSLSVEEVSGWVYYPGGIWIDTDVVKDLKGKTTFFEKGDVDSSIYLSRIGNSRMSIDLGQMIVFGIGESVNYGVYCTVQKDGKTVKVESILLENMHIGRTVRSELRTAHEAAHRF
jgi:hypothetical protein